MFRLSRSLLCQTAAVAAIAVLAPGYSLVLAAPGPSTLLLREAGAAEINDVLIRVPRIPQEQPLQVVVALHGMGGSGTDFGTELAAQADHYGWLLVAPTISYGDWTDPAQITREDPALAAWLSDYLAQLPERIGMPTQSKVLLFGHSRGAQLALRFTEIHP